MKNDIFADMKELVSEKLYQSTFDFASFEISEDDKEYIVTREEILFTSFKKMSSSLYDICKALYEIKLKFKDDGGSFAAWYRHNHLSKDKVSELLKRYELFIQVPDKKEYISSLSIPAVKLLTKKDLEFDTLDNILQLELKDVDDIQDAILEAQPVIEEKERKKENPALMKVVKKFKKNISKATTLKELVQQKKELEGYKKMLQELINEIENKEKAQENENNLQLPVDDPAPVEVSEKKVYRDNRGWIFFVRSGLGENTFKAFYAKNVEDYQRNIRCHAVKTLEWQSSENLAQVDLDRYANSKKMELLNLAGE
ncbi:MAG: hypothetical protein SOR11_07570 [Fusobacterium sp.]|uniref:hypothetical protein n=1 Tax=Fusobacterium sp. TaxID=68766 RepID=UPI002A757DB1|nr:hypothetical protein [Fusobacterium sp.]MDY3059841.1 hypothetical protein [Fusobacterium sp.]